MLEIQKGNYSVVVKCSNGHIHSSMRGCCPTCGSQDYKRTVARPVEIENPEFYKAWDWVGWEELTA